MTTHDDHDPKGTCQEIKDLKGKVGTNLKLSIIYFKTMGKHPHNLNGAEMYQTVCIKLQQNAVDKLETDLEKLKVCRATNQATDGDLKDTETKLAEANAVLAYWKGCLESERTRKAKNRCKKILDSSSASEKKKRRAADTIYQLETAGSRKKARETTWSEEAKKSEDNAKKLEAKLKAAESKVEEFHSALVNEQAANKKLKAKLERSEAIIGKLVA